MAFQTKARGLIDFYTDYIYKYHKPLVDFIFFGPLVSINLNLA